jgi:hydroxymethylbilane synthase
VRKLIIATRQSRLALWQANHVKQLLERQGFEVSLLGLTTKGDQILDKPLAKVGGKALFIKELEQALIDGRADLAVHSLKDVPADLPAGFCLACILKREDPRDAWISKRYARLEDLPVGGVVGTSSLRRMVLLKTIRPDIKIKSLRGNLDTRLRKLDHSDYDAIVLAAIGLKRLGLDNRIRHSFGIQTLLPAPGQGALGIEILESRSDLYDLLQSLHHHETALGVCAERTVSYTMGASCSVPLAAYAMWKTAEPTNPVLCLKAIWGFKNGRAPLQVEATKMVRTLIDAKHLGTTVAKQLQDQGAIVS